MNPLSSTLIALALAVAIAAPRTAAAEPPRCDAFDGGIWLKQAGVGMATGTGMLAIGMGLLYRAQGADSADFSPFLFLIGAPITSAVSTHIIYDGCQPARNRSENIAALVGVLALGASIGTMVLLGVDDDLDYGTVAASGLVGVTFGATVSATTNQIGRSGQVSLDDLDATARSAPDLPPLDWRATLLRIHF